MESWQSKIIVGFLEAIDRDGLDAILMRIGSPQSDSARRRGNSRLLDEWLRAFRLIHPPASVPVDPSAS